MSKDKVRFGLVGGGVIAPFHVKAINASPLAELAGIADIREDAGKKLADEHGVSFTTDYREMLRSGDVDAVSVLTPSGLHSEVAIAAAEHGVHVMVEKPIDITLEAIDRMIGACRRKNVKLGVIFQQRASDVGLRVYDAIHDGKLGRMTLGQASLKAYRAQSYYDKAEWRGTWALDGGGALMNQGVHAVDFLLWVMGDVKRVFAKSDHLLRDIEVEDTAVAVLEFAGGTFGTIEGTTSTNPGEPVSYAFHGEKGTVLSRPGKILKWAVADDPAERAEPLEDLEELNVEREMTGHAWLVNDLAQAILEDREPSEWARARAREGGIIHEQDLQVRYRRLRIDRRLPRQGHREPAERRAGGVLRRPARERPAHGRGHRGEAVFEPRPVPQAPRARGRQHLHAFGRPREVRGARRPGR
jgi:predicted dehydrogenase